MMSVDYNPAMKCVEIIKDISTNTKMVCRRASSFFLMTKEVLANEK